MGSRNGLTPSSPTTVDCTARFRLARGDWIREAELYGPWLNATLLPTLRHWRGSARWPPGEGTHPQQCVVGRHSLKSTTTDVIVAEDDQGANRISRYLCLKEAFQQAAAPMAARHLSVAAVQEAAMVAADPLIACFYALHLYHAKLLQDEEEAGHAGVPVSSDSAVKDALDTAVRQLQVRGLPALSTARLAAVSPKAASQRDAAATLYWTTAGVLLEASQRFAVTPVVGRRAIDRRHSSRERQNEGGGDIGVFPLQIPVVSDEPQPLASSTANGRQPSTGGGPPQHVGIVILSESADCFDIALSSNSPPSAAAGPPGTPRSSEMTQWAWRAFCALMRPDDRRRVGTRSFSQSDSCSLGHWPLPRRGDEC